jgi:two-component system response regulator HydG
MTGRALVVDDDAAMLRTLSDVLQLRGWEVRAVHSGDAAVQAVREGDFDVVLMDVKMPGMDGVDAFKVMKSEQPRIRVVLMTAYAEQARLDEAEEHGVAQVLSKPLNIAALLALLDQHFSAQRSLLVVDSDATFLRTLRDVLVQRGYNVATATDVSDAMELMDRSEPIAVMLHVPAGAQSARDAVAAVHARDPSVALILYSGQADAPLAVRDALDEGWAQAFLRKPFAIDQLTEVLDDIRAGH